MQMKIDADFHPVRSYAAPIERAANQALYDLLLALLGNFQTIE
jgi:hypothetical protein